MYHFSGNEDIHMVKNLLAAGIAMMVVCCTLADQTVASAQPAHNRDLVSEYSKHMGLSKNQVLDATITNSVLKLSINECSFCGLLKDEKARSDMAHTTLNWFLTKTGQSEGTVEWYNKSREKIMVITGSSAQAEISTGPSCAIQNRQPQ